MPDLSENKANARLHIFLIRHYKPQLVRAGFFNHIRAKQFINDYDAAGIETLINKPAGLPYAEIKRVHTSALPRAKQTALALFGPGVALVEDKIFNECERKILALPLLQFPIKVWLAGARLLWLMGLNSQGIETYRQARQRARQAAETLINYAAEEQNTVLVAHGMLNLFIKQFLKQTGWQIIRQEGNGYLAVTELIKTAIP